MSPIFPAHFRCADDGLYGPPLPLPAPAGQPGRSAVHGNGHGARRRARTRRTPARVRPGGISGRVADRWVRPEAARACGEARRAARLCRDQPERRVPERSSAGRQLRRLPDGRAAAGHGLPERDARCREHSRDHQVPHRHRRARRLRFLRAFRAGRATLGRQRLHRACAQGDPAGPHAEGEPRDPAAALRDGRAPQARESRAHGHPERRAQDRWPTCASGGRAATG